MKFYFVSVWNNGDDGRAMLTKYELADQPNVTILADPGPRTGDAKIKRFLDLPLSWIPDDLDLQRRRSALRPELRRNPVRRAPAIFRGQQIGVVDDPKPSDMMPSRNALRRTQKPPSILSLIGDTPLVEITRMDTGPCQLFVKLENQNPTGSIKDRIALAMIEAAERDGKLQPGGTIIEATAGNTGLGLALIAGAKGYRIILVIPDKMSQEKIAHVRALGAEVRLTRSDVTRGHPEYYQDIAARLASEIPGAFYVNQFGNPANPLTHETTTGPEIWEADGAPPRRGRCAASAPAARSPGSRRFFARVQPNLEMVLADPTGSILFD